MLIGGLDFEATSADPKEARIIEIGAALWDPGTGVISQRYSCLVHEPEHPKLSDEVRRITGLDDDILERDGCRLGVAVPELAQFLAPADYLMAYNIKYDRTLLEAECARLGLPAQFKKPWLCAYEDVEYPDHFRCRQLAHLALDHGIVVDPELAHRAHYDVELFFHILRGYDIDKVIAYSKSPWTFVQAIIPAPWTDGGKGKEAAQARKYSWERPRMTDVVFPKAWVKRIKQHELQKEKAEAPFPVEEVHAQN